MPPEADWARALLDPQAPLPSGLKTWNGSDPAARFAVYRNNVTVSLTTALAETFAVTRQLVGEEFFSAMAREFVRRAPPRTALLAEYGAEFPQFIAGFPPAKPLPYLADVARLELLYVRAYHAADAQPVDPQQLQAADPGRCRLQLHPSLHTLQSGYATVSLWAAHQGHGQLGEVDPYAAENAWILRSGLQVAVLRMRAGDCRLVQALQNGQSLELAAEVALNADPDFDLTACLAVMLREELIVEIEHS